MKSRFKLKILKVRLNWVHLCKFTFIKYFITYTSSKHSQYLKVNHKTVVFFATSTVEIEILQNESIMSEQHCFHVSSLNPLLACIIRFSYNAPVITNIFRSFFYFIPNPPPHTAQIYKEKCNYTR